jgi:putative transposase
MPSLDDKQIYMNGTLTNSYITEKENVDSSKTIYVDIDDENKEDIMYTKKIRFYPSKEQKQKFEEYFGCSRFIWNECVEYVKDTTKSATQISMRNVIMGTDANLPEERKWMTLTPYDSRQNVIRSFLSCRKSAFTNLGNKNIKHFEIKKKEKKEGKQVFFINNDAINKDLHLFPTRLNKKLRIRNKLKKWMSRVNFLEHECKIIRDNSNRYYLCLSFKREVKELEPTFKMVGLDPGTRTFQTFYSNEGVCGKLGENITEKLIPLALKVDKFTSLRFKKKEDSDKFLYPARKRRHMNIRCKKLRAKISNITDDLHWKSASFLVKNFKVIFLPSFETSKMAKKMDGFKKRCIGTKSVRSMLTLSHYKFQQRLIHLASTYKGRSVIVCDEHYTSKTCGCCGFIKTDLKGKEIYECDKCNLVVDRDINASRNILLRQISKLRT